MRGNMMIASRKILYTVTVIVTLLLIVCTVASKMNYDARIPEVEVVKPESTEINGEMYYSAVVPKSTVFTGAENKTYVYVVRQRKGLFGEEYYVVQAEISIQAENDTNVAIGGRNVNGNDNIVLQPDEMLASADVVKVKA